MRLMRHVVAHVAPLVGVGLMLAGLGGGPVLPAASAAAVARFTYHHDWQAQDP
jgi:hypothetical protein